MQGALKMSADIANSIYDNSDREKMREAYREEDFKYSKFRTELLYR